MRGTTTSRRPRRTLAGSVLAVALGLGGTALGSAPAAGAPIPPLAFTSLEFQVGANPTDVVLGDFDRQRGLDFASAHFSGDVWTYLHGTRHRAFAIGGIFDASERSASQMAAADFNADGHLDLAVTSPTTNHVNILLGSASGNFFPPQPIVVGEFPSYLTIGDFDQNGDPDIAVSSTNDDAVTILLGVAGGGFIREADIGVGNLPEGIVALDANGDFDLDLAVVNIIDDNVEILVGGPGGSFRPSGNFGVGWQPIAIDTGDFNGDGDPDLAVADSADDGVSVLYGIEGARFAGRQAFYTGDDPRDLVVTDLNGDLDPDIAVVNRGSATLAIAMGQPATGVFDPPTLHSTGPGPNAVAAADMDGNGLQDLVVANGSSTRIRLFFQKGATPPTVSLEGPSAVEAGKRVLLRARASDADGEVHFYDWDLDGDGTFESQGGSLFEVFTNPVPAGTTTYRVRAIDDDGNRAEASITIRAGARPFAALRASADAVEIGQRVTLDASGSTDADGEELHYRFDTDGDGTYETEGREPTATSAPVPAGGELFGVEVVDEIGLVDTAHVFVLGGARPVASLVAQPPAVLVGEGTTLDATGSTSTNGALTYAFDLDGNGSYESPDADGRVAVSPYPTSGTRSYGVRVTDAVGLSSTATTSVAVGKLATTLRARSILASLGGSVAATLTRSAGGQPVAGRTVVFTTPAGAVLCSAVTNGAGHAECRTILPFLGALLQLGYRATFAGDDSYLPSAAVAGLL